MRPSPEIAAGFRPTVAGPVSVQGDAAAAHTMYACAVPVYPEAISLLLFPEAIEPRPGPASSPAGSRVAGTQGRLEEAEQQAGDFKDETFRSAQNAAPFAALPKSRKEHKCDFLAAIARATEKKSRFASNREATTAWRVPPERRICLSIKAAADRRTGNDGQRNGPDDGRTARPSGE